MDPVFGIMLDVARIVTFQPHGIGAETRPAEREHEIEPTGAVGAGEFVPTPMHETRREAMRLSRWFRFSLSTR